MGRGTVLAAMLMMAACAEDDEGGAREACEELVTTLCDSVVACAVAGDLTDDPAELREKCEEAARESAHCDDATSVNDNYEACLEDASVLDCDQSNALLSRDSLPAPPVCEGAIQYR